MGVLVLFKRGTIEDYQKLNEGQILDSTLYFTTGTITKGEDNIAIGDLYKGKSLHGTTRASKIKIEQDIVADTQIGAIELNEEGIHTYSAGTTVGDILDDILVSNILAKGELESINYTLKSTISKSLTPIYKGDYAKIKIEISPTLPEIKISDNAFGYAQGNRLSIQVSYSKKYQKINATPVASGLTFIKSTNNKKSFQVNQKDGNTIKNLGTFYCSGYSLNTDPNELSESKLQLKFSSTVNSTNDNVFSISKDPGDTTTYKPISDVYINLQHEDEEKAEPCVVYTIDEWNESESGATFSAAAQDGRNDLYFKTMPCKKNKESDRYTSRVCKFPLIECTHDLTANSSQIFELPSIYYKALLKGGITGDNYNFGIINYNVVNDLLSQLYSISKSKHSTSEDENTVGNISNKTVTLNNVQCDISNDGVSLSPYSGANDKINQSKSPTILVITSNTKYNSFKGDANLAIPFAELQEGLNTYFSTNPNLRIKFKGDGTDTFTDVPYKGDKDYYVYIISFHDAEDTNIQLI